MIKFNKNDIRSRYIPFYKLVKEYPGFKDRLGLEISKEGYSKNGVIPIVHNPEDFPEFWSKIESKVSFESTIAINTDQRYKLITMIKALFITDYGEKVWSISNTSNSSSTFIIFNADSGPEYYHWFQFCYDQLAKAIYNKLDPNGDADKRIEFQNETILDNQTHPVDWLYADFQDLIKLKL
jgi:hypothetical protein